MGRGKWDNCSNCIYGTEYKKGVYTCKCNRNEEYEKTHWCKNHESEDEQ